MLRLRVRPAAILGLVLLAGCVDFGQIRRDLGATNYGRQYAADSTKVKDTALAQLRNFGFEVTQESGRDGMTLLGQKGSSMGEGDAIGVNVAAMPNGLTRVKVVRQKGIVGGGRDWATELYLGIERELNVTDRTQWGAGSNQVAAAPAMAPAVPSAGGAGGGTMAIAVLDLDAQGVGSSDAAVATDWLRGALVKTGRFTVVERKSMEKVLSEQALQQTGCTSQECAVKLGKLLNVNRIIVGGFGKFLSTYAMNVRVVDVESGKVILAEEAKGKNEDELSPAIDAMAGRLGAMAR